MIKKPDLASNDVVVESREKTAGRKHFWVSGPPIFSAEQLQVLKTLVDTENAPALVERDPTKESTNSLRSDYRRTKVRWLNVAEHKWVYEIIWAEANKANALFEFDVVPMRDQIQLAVYDEEESGFFTWHTDIVPSDLTRKISITVPLNNGEEFEGGHLEFRTSGRTRPPQIAGVPIIFPSWLLHQVTPVTAGKRYSLVAWIRGPSWK